MTTENNYEGPPVSEDAPVPRWLFWMYVILPFWGLFTFYIYWNGSVGWLDRGYWKQLQEAANTTYPFQENSIPKDQQ